MLFELNEWMCRSLITRVANQIRVRGDIYSSLMLETAFYSMTGGCGVDPGPGHWTQVNLSPGEARNTRYPAKWQTSNFRIGYQIFYVTTKVFIWLSTLSSHMFVKRIQLIWCILKDKYVKQWFFTFRWRCLDFLWPKQIVDIVFWQLISDCPSEITSQ